MSSWLVASGVAAAPRLSVGPVRGDPKAAIPAQLATALCGAFECVLWPEVSTRREPDLAKARRLGVAGLLTGVVSPGLPGPTATLSLLTTSTRPVRTWTFPLSPAGNLQHAALRQLEKELPGLVQPPLPAPAVAAAAAPRQPTQVPPPVTPPAPRAAPPPPAPAQQAPSAAAAAPPRAPEAVDRRAPSAAAELGIFLLQRQLTYGGVSAMSGTLQSFDAAAIAGPRLRVEVFPAARSATPALRGAGLFADYAASVGLHVVAPTGEERSASYSRLELGASWRSAPLGSLRLVLVPRLSYQALKVTVSPTISGLPDADLSGVAVGLGAEARVSSSVVALVSAGYVKWLSAEDLIAGSPPYFPGGQAWALQAEAGAAVALWGPWSLRLVGEYASTSYALDADPTGTYAATSAQDRTLGVRAMVRGEY